MKLTHFAHALTIALLLVTAYLAYESLEESKRASEKLNRLTAQYPGAGSPAPVSEIPVPGLPPSSPEAALPVVAATPSLPPTPLPTPAPVVPSVSTEPTAASLAAVAGSPGLPQPPAATEPTALPPSAAPAGQPAPLTPLQRRVADAPSLGKISEVVPEHGFVTFSAPADVGLKEGMKFDLRRQAAVVGRITIVAVEPGAVLANLDAKSVPAGLSVQQGDEVISVIMVN